MTGRNGNGWGRRIAAASLIGLFSVSCAEEIADIDRTNPDKLLKTQFSGVFYYLQTMIDVPQQSAQGFIGNTNFGNSAKVMFEITEDWMYVLPVQETVQFSEKPYQTRKVRNFWDADKSHEFVEIYAGQPLAAFPVSHFDVQREYNSSTGSQSNVLTENTTDRVWHERKYIRVDWGANAIMDWNFPLGSSKFSPVDHYVTEVEDPFLKPEGAGDNPDKPEFEEGYISFVTKAYVAPSTANWMGALCDPYSLSNTDCAGSVIKVRHSFKQAPATPDYETINYTNREHMDKFGFFLAERYAYDQLYDLTESGRDYKGQRWNLWQTTWQHEEMKNADGTPMACNDHVDCGTDGNVLDTKANRCVRESLYQAGVCQKGTLKKLADRGLNPVIYHLSAAMPPEQGSRMRDQFYKSADEWSRAFKDAVAWGIALEEKGQYWTRGCTTNADCTKDRADVALDTTIAMPREAADGEKGVSCDTTNPCAKNQYCKDSVCFWAAGNPQSGQVVEPKLVKGTRRATFVIGQNDKNEMILVPVKEDQSGLTGATVRFVNLTSDAQTLSVSGKTLTHAYKADEWVTETATVTAGNADFSVAGQARAQSVVNGWEYLVVYTGSTLIISGNLRTSSVEGVRFLHAIPDGAPVDASVNAIRVGAELRYETLSAYGPQTFDEARVAILTAGAQGDVTCYYTQHEGRCTGYSGTWSDKDDERVAKLQSTLPDMFVLCENQYDQAGEAAALEKTKETYLTRGQTWIENISNPWSLKNPTGKHEPSATELSDARYSVKGKNPYNWSKPELADKNAISNPCKDFVPHPTELKKIGDVRYNYIYWVGENQAASPLGYGPSAGDPETGQLIWGTAYIYGAPTLTYGQAAMDLVDLVNGNISTEDVISGDYIRDYVVRKGDANPPDNTGSLFEGGLAARDSAEAELLSNSVSAQFDRDGVVHAATDPFANAELYRFMTDKAFQKQLLQGVPSVGSHYSKSRMDKIRGTTIEDQLINSEVRLAMTGSLDQSPLTPQQRQTFSPASWGTGSAALHAAGMSRDHTHAKGPCTYEQSFMDDNIYGIAKEFFCTPAEKAQYDADPATVSGKTCIEGSELRWEITARILSGLIEHEVGHTVGLRHNFGGSVDLFNFKDEYYDVREKEKIYCKSDGHCDQDYGETCLMEACGASKTCPAGLTCTAGECLDGSATQTGLCSLNGVVLEKLAPHPVNKESERLGKMAEYQYSTVMDYGAVFNSDVHGLGKYDYAAMKFGYLRLVDVYRDTSKMTDRIQSLAKRFGNDPSNFAYFLDTDGWRYAGVLFSPFYYLENYIGVEQNKKRRPVSYEQVKLEHAMQSNYNSGELYWSFIEVPYRFCSDEFNGNLGCYTWDAGVDAGEMVNTSITKLDEHYIIDAFMRESLYKGNQSFINTYYNRLLTRYMNILADTGRYFAIYDNIFRDRSWYADFSSNIYSLGTLANASRRSFNHLAETLASPSPGTFVQDAAGIYRNVNYDTTPAAAAGDELIIPVGKGKFPYTQFLSGGDYNFQDHVLFVGSFWSKLAALVTLTDSTFYSSSDFVGEQLQIGRSTSVGFNTLYQREMTNLLGGIVSESLDQYSGVVDVDPQGNRVFRSRDLFDTTGDPGMATIEPSLNNLTMKLYAGTYGMANLPAGFDPSFTDAMSVFVKGDGQQFDLNESGAGVEVAEFADPFAGKTYVAYTPNYDEGRFAPAFAIVKRAQENRVKWEAASASSAAKAELERQLKKDIEVLDSLRSLHNIYGSLTY